MSKLNVIQGGYKEPRNYKPMLMDYVRVQIKATEELQEKFGNITADAVTNNHADFRKLIYSTVKAVGRMDDKTLNNESVVETLFDDFSRIFGFIGCLTPRQFIQIFPIEKTYDGKRWETKDYFSTMKAVNEIGLDNRIGSDRTPKFLMAFRNWDVDDFMVNFMLTANHMRVLQGGKGIVEEWMEKQGAPTYSYHEEEGIMINQQTGEVTKVEKPKTKIPKYMKVIEGGESL